MHSIVVFFLALSLWGHVHGMVEKRRSGLSRVVGASLKQLPKVSSIKPFLEKPDEKSPLVTECEVPQGLPSLKLKRTREIEPYYSIEYVSDYFKEHHQARNVVLFHLPIKSFLATLTNLSSEIKII